MYEYEINNFSYGCIKQILAGIWNCQFIVC